MKYIFEARIKPGHTIEEYREAWKVGSSIIQQQPGSRGTKLHRKIGDDQVLVAIAEWESKEARDRAMANLEKVDPETRELLDKHKTIAEITTIGSFEEIASSMSPEGQSPSAEIKA